MLQKKCEKIRNEKEGSTYNNKNENENRITPSTKVTFYSPAKAVLVLFPVQYQNFSVH